MTIKTQYSHVDIPESEKIYDPRDYSNMREYFILDNSLAERFRKQNRLRYIFEAYKNQIVITKFGSNEMPHYFWKEYINTITPASVTLGEFEDNESKEIKNDRPIGNFNILKESELIRYYFLIDLMYSISSSYEGQSLLIEGKKYGCLRFDVDTSEHLKINSTIFSDYCSKNNLKALSLIDQTHLAISDIFSLGIMTEDKSMIEYAKSRQIHIIQTQDILNELLKRGYLNKIQFLAETKILKLPKYNPLKIIYFKICACFSYLTNFNKLKLLFSQILK
ncbi:MAG: hypothetical protein WCT08_06165 [Patescibacteria group bacterium]|jgi:hypothetical protein